MKKVFKMGFFYLVVFAMVLGNSVLSIDFSIPVAHAITIENTQFEEGNPSCIDLGYDNEYKVDPPSDGTYTTTEGDITLTNTGTGQFDWSSTFGIDGVIAKGGDGANVYTYNPASTGGNGLLTPLNGGDQRADLSHASFCYNDPEPYCELTLTKSDEGFEPIAPGAEITYHLTLTNTGTADCNGVWLKDYYDANTSYVSTTLTPTINDPGYRVGWWFNTITPGNFEEVDLTMLVKDETACDSTLTNTAKFKLDSENTWTEIAEQTSVVCEDEDQCTTDSDDYNGTLDMVNIGDTLSEASHPIDGWSSANISGGYGGCQNGVVCDYRQVIEEDLCTEEGRGATTILHAGEGLVDSITIRHLDGISLMDSFDVYINDQYIANWLDETQISSETWRETTFDLSDYEFSGDLQIKLVATDDIWNLCGTYGQVAIDWISMQGCGDTWEASYCGDGNIDRNLNEQCDDGNAEDGDGCSASCTTEGSQIECGNEKREASEQCDDGNAEDGDGCTANCSLENTYECEDITSQNGWYGQYFNYLAEHPDMDLPSGQWPDDGHGDPLGIWNTDWYDSQYFKFNRVDDNLMFGGAFFPMDFAAEEIHNGHDYHFGIHWRAQVTTDTAGDYDFSATSDDDLWVYLDGVLVAENDGIHAPSNINGTMTLDGSHIVDIFFAERHVTQSHMSFEFADETLDIVPMPEECAICGNGIVEGDEECDAGLNGSITCTTECTISEQPPICYVEGEPFFASTVFSYDQGQKKDGSNVDANRSVPEQGLVLELGQNVSNFFSLGFGGWTIVSFDNVFVDGPGNDIKITEDTWGGGYPLEKADVYVSQDGTTWAFLGTADNTNLNVIHTTSEFDLAATGLTWGQYIKVVDTSDPSVHSASADGYDLNAVEALSGGYIGECEDVITVCKMDEQENPLADWEMTLYGSNLITNGGFETPILSSGSWSIYPDASLTSWTVNSGDGLEIQYNAAGAPHGGNQLAELDSNNSSVVSQTITTIPGEEYNFSFWYSPRPGIGSGDNTIGVSVQGVGDSGFLVSDTIGATAVGGSNTTWALYEYSFTATQTSTEIKFADLGTSNSLGGYLDDVVLLQTVSGLTEENGCVEFVNLSYDIYQVMETMQEGWEQIEPIDLNYFTVDFNEENDNPTVTFVNKRNFEEPTYDVHGYKWEDINGNGLRDCEFLVTAAVTDLQTPLTECESVLSGWTINLYEGESSTPLMTMDTSDAADEHFGWYWFEGLLAGDYRICEELKNGWQQIYPGEDGCHWISLPNDESQTQNAVLAPEYNFANQQLSEGQTYCGDGIIQTPNDEGIGGPENDGNEQCDINGQACTTEDGYAGTQSCNMSYEESQLLACTWNLCVTEEECGDGLLNGNEQCDHGPDGSSTCTTQCETIPEPPCTVNCGVTTTGGGGGGGPVTFSIKNLNTEVSCSGVEMSWLTNLISDTILDYGTSSGVYTEHISNDTNATGHEITLTGLLSNTTYYYQVRAISGTGTEIKVVEKSFTTPPVEQCGAVLGEKIGSPLLCDFLRPSGSHGQDQDINGVIQYPDGSLLRDACNKTMPVYLIKDQQKWHIPNWKYLHDHYFGQRIYNILSTVLNNYPNWTPKVLGVKYYADGTLLRGSNMKVYIIEDGHKRHITSLEELLKYAGQEIINVSDEVLNQY